MKAVYMALSRGEQVKLQALMGQNMLHVSHEDYMIYSRGKFMGLCYSTADGEIVLNQPQLENL